jgi:2,3-bisphosphoglycerate-independent phosphoglycerate mutase
MDGWGINARRAGNAVLLAKTPNLTRLKAGYPSTELDTSGRAVGLPEGQMGNSEVGHITIGAGRVVYQDLTRITDALAKGELKRNPVFGSLINGLLASGAALHVMGLVSDGGVHSHIDHLSAIVDEAVKRGVKRVFVHAFLDGRDTPPRSGKGYVEALEGRLAGSPHARIATVSGRYYAMDRDNRWERVRKAYEAIAEGRGVRAEGAVKAVEDAYARGETDEFVTPAVVTHGGTPVAALSDNDAVMFINFRADRAREITAAFVEAGFEGFRRARRPPLSGFVCMTEYDQRLKLPVLFRPEAIENILPEVLSRSSIRQFRVSETEKYAHVTFFFNGGREEPFPGEERLLIPSVTDVPTYDMRPEMRATDIARAAVERIRSGDFGFMLINFANGDMVGHTGDLDAAVKACESVDASVGMVADEALDRGWAVFITSDHGNAEQMLDEATGGAFTAHSTNPVPFMLVDDERRDVSLRRGGGLKDIAPTVLKVMGIEIPPEMLGTPLF